MHHAYADRFLVALLLPVPEFGNGRIGFSLHMLAVHFVIIIQLRRHVTALRPRSGFSGQSPATGHLGNIGHADNQCPRGHANSAAAARRREHTVPQVLRTGLLPVMWHACLRPCVSGDLQIIQPWEPRNRIIRMAAIPVWPKLL